ncbi:MAG: hypothetical protein EXS36_12010 [Pedosphaera sp.]|nr:hypothetical protein [Pedosphaera sp.]
MKTSKFKTLLFSALGVGLVFIAIVGTNLLFAPVRARMDLTADKLHTLSAGTKRILAKLDSPVEVRYYASRGNNRLPGALKNYAQSIEDLLSELKAQSRGNLELKKFDPEPDSEAEELAKLDGIEPQMLQNGESFYLGVAVVQDPQKVPLPFLSPQREKLLEYDLARAISQVMSTNKAVIGVMSPLPVFGMSVPPQMMMRMGGQQGQEPWVVINELKRDFQVEQVGMDVEKIDEKIKVLVVIHPKEISEKAQFALDQFVLRGGKLIGFLDALCLADNKQPNPMGFNMGGGSSLPKLLKAWGLEFDTGKVVADPTFSTKPLSGRDGRPQYVPSFLFLTPEGINKEDAVTSQSDDLWIPFPGAFTGTPVAGLKQDVLLKSSLKAQLVDGITSQLNGQKVLDELRPANVNFALAVRLTGKFKTAFPDGRPGAEKKDDKGEKKDAEKKAEPATDMLKESAGDGIVYLFGDADFLYDPYCVEVNQMFHMAFPRNGNLALVQNLIEQAAGDAFLMGARSRASLRRPFTKIQQIETEARLKYQARVEGLEKDQQAAQQELSQIQIKKEGNTARIILSPEQKAAIERLRKKQTETGKELKQVRKNLRQDVESLENKLKWSNIALMPLLVSVAGVGFALARRNRQGAK